MKMGSLTGEIFKSQNPLGLPMGWDIGDSLWLVHVHYEFTFQTLIMKRYYNIITINCASFKCQYFCTVRMKFIHDMCTFEQFLSLFVEEIWVGDKWCILLFPNLVVYPKA